MPWKKPNTAAEKDEPKSSSQKAKTIIGLILCVLLIPILVVNVSLIVKSYTKTDEIPNIGGIFPLIVMTDSMYPQIQSGDLIICHTIDAKDVKVGDVICFFDPEGNGTSTVTHRVIEITQTEEGELAFRTKGDANNAADRVLAPASKLVGLYQSRLPGVGNAAMFMQTTTGLIVCVVVPMLLLVAIDLLRTRRFEKTHKQDTDALMRELEELRARQAAIAVSAEAKAETAPPVEKETEETPPAEKPEETPAEKKPEETPSEEKPEEPAAEEETKKVLPEEAPQEETPPADESGNEAPEEEAALPAESDAETGDEIAETGEGEIAEGGGGVGEGGGGDV